MVIRTTHNETKAEEFIKGTKDEDNGPRPIVNMRFDPGLLRRIDSAAKKMGMTRSAWIHMATARQLGLDDTQ